VSVAGRLVAFDDERDGSLVFARDGRRVGQTRRKPCEMGLSTLFVRRGARCEDEADEGASTLTPGHTHVAGKRGSLVSPVYDEIMPFGLAADRLINRSIKQIIARRSA
jgi:hypothetical protein